MISIRPAQDRGHFDFGWLNTYHTFSFGDYHDPQHMGFRNLRVINEDVVQPGKGFGTHPHRDMEIITVVLEGALQHKDSMGNGSVIRPGEVQRMSAGTGVTHSEFNPSDKTTVHLLQIWILPEQKGRIPSYEQKKFDPTELRGKLKLVASRAGREGSVSLHQDVDLYAAQLNDNEELKFPLRSNRFAWVQVAKGKIHLNGLLLHAGDGAAVSEEEHLNINADPNADFFLFDLN